MYSASNNKMATKLGLRDAFSVIMLGLAVMHLLVMRNMRLDMQEETRRATASSDDQRNAHEAAMHTLQVSILFLFQHKVARRVAKRTSLVNSGR